MKLSIITINLNNREGLLNTIESVVNQSYSDFEFIVIDGNSTDGSVDIINQYSDKITYWVSESDKGIYSAMNKGILRAKGEYCLFLNSGDHLISVGILDMVFNLKLNTDIFCYNVFGKRPDEIHFFDLYQKSLLHQSMFIKTSLFRLVGLYDENYKIISDWIFYTLALVKYNCSLSFYNFRLFQAQQGGISWTDGDTIYKERELFMNKNFPYFISDYEELSIYKASRVIQLYNKLRNNKAILKVHSFIIR